jgi:hypothetical protein
MVCTYKLALLLRGGGAYLCVLEELLHQHFRIGYIHFGVGDWSCCFTIIIQGGSNMTGTCEASLHTTQSRSYLNHLVYMNQSLKSLATECEPKVLIPVGLYIAQNR